MTNSCQTAEVLAGAIALGEATDAERLEYRRHVATCAACLRAHGGEREIERTMSLVTGARDQETWEPDITTRLRERMNGRKRFLRAGFSVLGACLAISIIGHFFIVAGLAKIEPTISDPLVVRYDGQRITLERRSTAERPVATAPPKVAMVVTHNVVNVTLPAPPRTTRANAPARTMLKPRIVAHQQTTTVEKPVTGLPSGDGNVPIWRKGGGAFTTVSHSSSSAFEPEHNAESIQVAPAYSVREPAPLGGESALNPQPPSIAYAQGAQGTTVFEVQIDERGVPTKCTVTASSGFLSLDNAVCKAAMQARYTPKIVNGKPAPGIYRDAFTFRTTNANEGI